MTPPLTGLEPFLFSAEALALGSAPGFSLIGRFTGERFLTFDVRSFEAVHAESFEVHHVRRTVGGEGRGAEEKAKEECFHAAQIPLHATFCQP